MLHAVPLSNIFRFFMKKCFAHTYPNNPNNPNTVRGVRGVQVYVYFFYNS